MKLVLKQKTLQGLPILEHLLIKMMSKDNKEETESADFTKIKQIVSNLEEKENDLKFSGDNEDDEWTNIEETDSFHNKTEIPNKIIHGDSQRNPGDVMILRKMIQHNRSLLQSEIEEMKKEINEDNLEKN